MGFCASHVIIIRSRRSRSRAPLLFLANGKDHTVPAVSTRAAYRIQKKTGALRAQGVPRPLPLHLLPGRLGRAGRLLARLGRAQCAGVNRRARSYSNSSAHRLWLGACRHDPVCPSRRCRCAGSSRRRDPACAAAWRFGQFTLGVPESWNQASCVATRTEGQHARRAAWQRSVSRDAVVS
jgi:hypothetical protein